MEKNEDRREKERRRQARNRRRKKKHDRYEKVVCYWTSVETYRSRHKHLGRANDQEEAQAIDKWASHQQLKNTAREIGYKAFRNCR